MKNESHLLKKATFKRNRIDTDMNMNQHVCKNLKRWGKMEKIWLNQVPPDKKLSKRTYVNCFDGGNTYCIEMQVCVGVA